MLRVSPVLGSQAKRIRALNTPADLYIINRENVVWLVDYYRNAWPFDMVIVDESSSFKSHSAKRFKALASVGDRIERMVEPVSYTQLDVYKRQDVLMNAYGVRVDTDLIDGALYIDGISTQKLTDEAVRLTGLANPNSAAQLVPWLNDHSRKAPEDPDM